jgi:hypothetical protein
MSETLPIYWDIQTAIRQATRSDEYADLASEPATALRDLRRTLNRASREITGLLHHEHQWGATDSCNICGADGRA